MPYRRIRRLAVKKGVPPTVIHRLIRERKLRAIRPGKRVLLVDEDDFDRCLAELEYIPPLDSDEPDLADDVARARTRGMR